MEIGGINSKGHEGIRLRVSQQRNGGKERLGMVEGGVKLVRPKERLPRTLKGDG